MEVGLSLSLTPQPSDAASDLLSLRLGVHILSYSYIVFQNSKYQSAFMVRHTSDFLRGSSLGGMSTHMLAKQYTQELGYVTLLEAHSGLTLMEHVCFLCTDFF